MYSDVHKQRLKADDFFDGAPQYANQTDVLLTSASDLETNVMNKGRLKKNIIRLPVDQCTGLYLQFIYIFYTYIIINNIIQLNCRGLHANFNDF